MIVIYHKKKGLLNLLCNLFTWYLELLQQEVVVGKWYYLDILYLLILQLKVNFKMKWQRQKSLIILPRSDCRTNECGQHTPCFQVIEFNFESNEYRTMNQDSWNHVSVFSKKFYRTHITYTCCPSGRAHGDDCNVGISKKNRTHLIRSLQSPCTPFLKTSKMFLKQSL